MSNLGLLVPQHLHQAAIAAVLRPTEAIDILLALENASDHFFDWEHLKALSVADNAAGIAPKPVTIEAVGDTFIQISWDAAEHANSYNVYFSLDHAQFEPCAYEKPVKIEAGDTTEFTITGLTAGCEYYIAVTAVDTNLGPYANESWYESSITGASIVKVECFGTSPVDDPFINSGVMPTEFTISQNYPNPFNPSTTIDYAVPATEHVSLKVYDMQGREVATLVDEQQIAGWYSVTLDASRLASGVYIYRIQTETFAKTMKLLLMK